MKVGRGARGYDEELYIPDLTTRIVILHKISLRQLFNLVPLIAL